MNSRIQTIHAREILNSRGNPTVEVDVTLSGGAPGDRKPRMGQK
jgi:enolase